MTADIKKFVGPGVQISSPFIDKFDGTESIIIRFFLDVIGSNELKFCDIQFPQEIVINKHHMSDDEAEAMCIFYDKFCEDYWRIARTVPDFDKYIEEESEE